jgi:hypothetical protein
MPDPNPPVRSAESFPQGKKASPSSPKAQPVAGTRGFLYSSDEVRPPFGPIQSPLLGRLPGSSFSAPRDFSIPRNREAVLVRQILRILDTLVVLFEESGSPLDPVEQIQKKQHHQKECVHGGLVHGCSPLPGSR